MKLITTIVRPERLPEVKAALFQAGVTGITLSRVSGHGGEQEIVSQYEVGDGKIFVQAIERVIRIRTGEIDNAALTAVNADAVQRAALETAHHA